MKRAGIAAWLAEWFGDEAATDEAIDWIAAALRAAESSALERAAQGCAEKARDYATRAAEQHANFEYEEAFALEQQGSAWRDAESLCRALIAPSPEAPPAPYGLTTKAAPSQMPEPICVPQPSEPVAPAGSALMAVLRDALSDLDFPPYYAHRIRAALTASPAAQGKETRGP